MTMDITTEIKNYNGKNSFVLKMKQNLKKYGSLTPNQLSAVEKILVAVNNIKSTELSDDMKKIVGYAGTNTFVNDLKTKFQEYGSLTEKQISAALTQIQKEEENSKTYKLNIPAPGDTIKVGRAVGEKLKEEYNLQFMPVLMDITKVIGVSDKAVKFSGKITVKRGSVCSCCMRTLTDEFSMLTGVGKTCAKNMGVPYITDSTQVEKFRAEFMKRVDEIGEMEFWVPKTQIKDWQGRLSRFLDMSKFWVKK